MTSFNGERPGSALVGEFRARCHPGLGRAFALGAPAGGGLVHDPGADEFLHELASGRDP